MMRAIYALANLVAFTSLAGPLAAACVENGTAQTLYFTVEAQEGEEHIGASDALDECLADVSNAIFTAFASGLSAEGCPGVSGDDGWDRLLAFRPTESCKWASHGE